MSVNALTAKQKKMVYSISTDKFDFVTDSTQNNSVEWLERQIRMGELLGRDDIVSSALEKLFSVAPQKSYGIAAKARLLLRQGKNNQAQLKLNQLKILFPEDIETQKLQKLWDINGSESNRYKQIKILELGGRTDDALKAYQALFIKDLFPTINIYLDYLNLAGKKDENWETVKQKLELLNFDNPQIPSLQLSLAMHLARQDSKNTWVNPILWQLAPDSVVGERAVLFLYSELEDQEMSTKWAQKYAKLASYFPHNSQIKSLNRHAQTRWKDEQTLLKDPHYRAKLQGLKLLALDNPENREKAYKLLQYASTTIKKDPQLLAGLGLYYLKIKESNAAVKYFKQALAEDTNNHNKYNSLILTAQYWGHLRHGDSLAEKDNIEQAYENYLSAYKLDKKNVYAQMSLAELALQEADYPKATKWFTNVLHIQPHHKTALEGMLTVTRLQQGNIIALRYAEAQCSRCKVILASSINNLKFDIKMEKLLYLVRHKKPLEALQIIEQLAGFKAIPPWTCKEIADQLMDSSEDKRAFEFINDCRKTDTSEDMQFAYSLFLSQQGQPDAALNALKEVPEEQRSTELKKHIEALELELQFSTMRQIRQTDVQQSDMMLTAIQNDKNTDYYTLIRVASAWNSFNNPKQALKVIRALPIPKISLDDLLFAGEVSLSAEDYKYAKVLFSEADKRSSTEAQNIFIALGLLQASQKLNNSRVDQHSLAYLKTHKSLLSLEQHIALVGILYHSEETVLAHDELQQLSNNNAISISGVSQLLELALENKQWALVDKLSERMIQLDISDKQDDTKQEKLSLALLYKHADDNWLANKAKSGISTSRARQQGHIKFGAQYGFRSGADSDLTIPFEALIAFPKLDGHLLFKADFVTIDSGDSTYFDNNKKLRLKDQGMGFGIGWLANNWQFDIGISPLGFLENNLVGGVQLTQSLGAFDFTPALSRRVSDDSALSYSGIDFAGNGIVGGVIENKASLGISMDQGGLVGFWGSVQFSLLTGHNVHDNNKTALLGGTYYKWLAEEDKKLNIGLNLFNMHYDKNLSENRFNHGGYYSPQRYFSISLPVSLSVRQNQYLSYSLYTSLSHSWSHSDGAYGTNERASNSSGFGFSMEATIEKRIAPKWYIGGMYNLSYSDDYAPHLVQLYVKYLFNESWDPVVIQPTPIELYSNYY
jgi:hypothetical protein